MDMETRLQKAIDIAVGINPVIGRRAFKRGADGQYSVRANALREYYSPSEAIIASVLLDVYHSLLGLPSGICSYPLPEGMERPSQLVWDGAPDAAKLIMRFSDNEQRIFSTLMGHT